MSTKQGGETREPNAPAAARPFHPDILTGQDGPVRLQETLLGLEPISQPTYHCPSPGHDAVHGRPQGHQPMLREPRASELAKLPYLTESAGLAIYHGEYSRNTAEPMPVLGERRMFLGGHGELRTTLSPDGILGPIEKHEAGVRCRYLYNYDYHPNKVVGLTQCPRFCPLDGFSVTGLLDANPTTLEDASAAIAGRLVDLAIGGCHLTLAEHAVRFYLARLARDERVAFGSHTISLLGPDWTATADQSYFEASPIDVFDVDITQALSTAAELVGAEQHGPAFYALITRPVDHGDHLEHGPRF